MTRNFFETFNLPVLFNIDIDMLNHQYRTLQKTIHPDRFVNATDAEKKQEGFDLTDVVQIDAQGNRKVLKSIPAGEKAKAATRKTVLSSIDKIVTDVDKLGTGFFEGRLNK